MGADIRRLSKLEQATRLPGAITLIAVRRALLSLAEKVAFSQTAGIWSLGCLCDPRCETWEMRTACDEGV